VAVLAHERAAREAEVAARGVAARREEVRVVGRVVPAVRVDDDLGPVLLEVLAREEEGLERPPAAHAGVEDGPALAARAEARLELRGEGPVLVEPLAEGVGVPDEEHAAVVPAREVALGAAQAARVDAHLVRGAGGIAVGLPEARDRTVEVARVGLDPEARVVLGREEADRRLAEERRGERREEDRRGAEEEAPRARRGVP
jgi:hypothetical protein